MVARVLTKGKHMEFAVFILLLLIILVLASPFIGVLSFIAGLLTVFVGFVARVVCAVIGFLRGVAARGCTNDYDRNGREGR